MAGPSRLRTDDPRQLGPYRLVGCLGSGGQGTVYLGESPAGDRVAVKVLHARLAREEQARERFLREVAAAQRVRQFCTARVLDVDLVGAQPYIVSEYVEGDSLNDVVRTAGPRDQGALMRLAVGTATALVAIHRAGIVHRDLKPSNVLLGADGPRVIDFGIARALDATITESPGPVGTPAYMSPEQISAGDRVGPPSDLFSWAATLYFAATGRSPFAAPTMAATFHRVLNETPDLSPLPVPLRSLVAACLAKNPQDRPTAAEALDALLGEEPSPSPPATEDAAPTAEAAPPSPEGRAAVAAVGLLVGLAALVVTAFIFWPSDTPWSGQAPEAAQSSQASPTATTTSSAATVSLIKKAPQACDTVSESQQDRLLTAKRSGRYSIRISGGCYFTTVPQGRSLNVELSLHTPDNTTYEPLERARTDFGTRWARAGQATGSRTLLLERRQGLGDEAFSWSRMEKGVSSRHVSLVTARERNLLVSVSYSVKASSSKPPSDADRRERLDQAADIVRDILKETVTA